MSQDVMVRPAAASTGDETELERGVIGALKANPQVPFERIAVTVHDGVVTLSGRVNWKYQSAAAVAAASAVQGVGVIDNDLVVEFG